MIKCERCNSMFFISVRDGLDIPYLICKNCGQATLDTRFIGGQKQALYEQLEPYRDTLEKCDIGIFELLERAETEEQLQGIRSLAALMVAWVYEEVYK
jgi:transcription elongation factor Elf1